MPPFDPDARHHRRSVRLRNQTYTSGSFFITICTEQRECLFGEIRKGKMELNEYGEIVAECWNGIPRHFPNALIDTFVVMPNHIHGILRLHKNTADDGISRYSCCMPHVGSRHAVTLQPDTPIVLARRFGMPQAGTIPTIIRSFKSAVTRRINVSRGNPGAVVWQRNYHERVIRGEELEHTRSYILCNPQQWERDRNFRAMLPADRYSFHL